MRELPKTNQSESFNWVPKMKNCLINYLFPLVNEQTTLTFKEAAQGIQSGRYSVP